MTQRDLTVQVCTLYCFLFSHDLISKRFMVSQSQFWQSINQSIIHSINQSINQSIHLSTNRWINRSNFINSITDHDRALYLLRLENDNTSHVTDLEPKNPVN